MSTTYKDLPGTNYPDSMDTFENKANIDSTMLANVSEYKKFLQQGNLTAAQNLLQNHPELQKTAITADDFNQLQDAMIAMQRYVKREKCQVICSTTEPTGEIVQDVGDIWIKISDDGGEIYELTTEGYICRLTTNTTKITEMEAAIDGKAPTNHRSTATTYGKGDGTNYGHLKLSASTTSTSDVSGGIAATPSAVKSAYDLAAAAMPKANFSLSGTTLTITL